MSAGVSQLPLWAVLPPLDSGANHQTHVTTATSLALGVEARGAEACDQGDFNIVGDLWRLRTYV